MGSASERMLKALDRGWWSPGDKYVCTECFEDYAIRDYIEAAAVKDTCSYCGNSSQGNPVAAPIDKVLELIADGLHSEWNDPDDEGIIYDSGEGGYQARLENTDEILFRIGLSEPVFANEDIQEEVIKAFGDSAWCESPFYSLSKFEALKYSWDDFARTVKHKTRFVFLAAPGDRSDWEESQMIPPARMLDALATVVTEAGLVVKIPAGSGFFRARSSPRNEPHPTARDLGSAPRDSATANRMSPTGIPMFYGACDEHTALDEISSTEPKEDWFSVGKFVTARDLDLVDLTHLPRVPSIFDEESRSRRAPFQFLHSFARKISALVIRDSSREHIDYVPTQILTEYFRRVYRTVKGDHVRGILYNSARRTGGQCCVLFIENKECTELTPGWTSDTDNWLALDKASITVRRAVAAALQNTG